MTTESGEAYAIIFKESFFPLLSLMGNQRILVAIQ
jgi:hypothetical protein